MLQLKVNDVEVEVEGEDDQRGLALILNSLNLLLEPEKDTEINTGESLALAYYDLIPSFSSEKDFKKDTENQPKKNQLEIFYYF